MNDALDGNAAAGALADVFVPEMTGAVTTCTACGDSRSIGELHAYLHAPGVILRCASCDAAQVRLVQTDGRVWLDLRGIRVLRVSLASTSKPDRRHDNERLSEP
jgi:hypothetical protein